MKILKNYAQNVMKKYYYDLITSKVIFIMENKKLAE
jgi:hypothetical protein